MIDMAEFKGYLVKFGSVALPNSYIKMDSGNTSTPNQREELKATRNDNTRKLYRVTADGMISQFSIVIRQLTNVQMSALRNVMNKGLLDKKQRKYDVTFWDDEELCYKNAPMYIPDITYERIMVGDNFVLYNSFTMEFIGYEAGTVVSG